MVADGFIEWVPFVRRAADWIILVAGLARVQCPHPLAIRSLATPVTVGIYVTAVRLTSSLHLKPIIIAYHLSPRCLNNC